MCRRHPDDFFRGGDALSNAEGTILAEVAAAAHGDGFDVLGRRLLEDELLNLTVDFHNLVDARSAFVSNFIAELTADAASELERRIVEEVEAIEVLKAGSVGHVGDLAARA